MRKIAIVLTTVAFFGCLAFGIWLSERSSLAAPLQSPPPTDIPTPAVLTHQTNVIFFHVDDLQTSRPVLRSLWGFFISLQDPASVIVTPLLPFASEETQARLVGSLRLDDRHALESRYADLVRKELNLTFAEYILIDDQGFNLAAQWVGERTGVPLDLAPMPGDTLLDREGAFFTAVCEGIIPEPEGEEPFIWNDILPDHAYTNLSLQNAVRIWATLTDPEKSSRCEVFYPDRTE